MNKKLIRVSACVLLLMLSGVTLLAQPASAATSVTWSGSSATPATVSDTSIVVTSTSGSRIFVSSNVVQGPGGSTCNSNANRSAYCEIPAGTTKTFTILASAVAGTVQFNDSASMFANTIATMTVTFQQATMSTDTTSPPTPVLHQFGRPATGSCGDGSPGTPTWAGLPSGGWGESWAQWMNDGTGGFVCSRMLVYNTAQSTWVLA